MQAAESQMARPGTGYTETIASSKSAQTTNKCPPLITAGAISGLMKGNLGSGNRAQEVIYWHLAGICQQLSITLNKRTGNIGLNMTCVNIELTIDNVGERSVGSYFTRLSTIADFTPGTMLLL